MPLTRTPLLSETVRKLVARGACVNAFNILSRLHPADIAGVLADLPEHLRREAFKTLHERNLTLAGALGFAMIGNLVIAAVVGTLVPLLLRRMKIVPALASSVFVTTATDVAGFLLFLGFGAAFLARFQ